jgi:hypothetical protein
VGVKNIDFLVPFPPAAALTSPAPPRGPPGLIFDGFGSYFDQLLGIFFLTSSAFESKENQIVEAENIV